MSNFNRQNPFMYLLETKEIALANKSQDAIKNIIILSIIDIITMILILINLFINHILLLLLLIAIICFQTIMLYLNVNDAVRSIHSGEINEMIFGDMYKDINVNNEKILAMIMEYNVAIGKVENLIEVIKYHDIIYLFISAVFIILDMTKFFM